MKCIKDNARVYIGNYDRTFKADIFRSGDTVVIKFHDVDGSREGLWGNRYADYAVDIGDQDYWDYEDGTLVTDFYLLKQQQEDV